MNGYGTFWNYKALKILNNPLANAIHKADFFAEQAHDRYQWYPAATAGMSCCEMFYEFDG